MYFISRLFRRTACVCVCDVLQYYNPPSVLSLMNERDRATECEISEVLSLTGRQTHSYTIIMHRVVYIYIYIGRIIVHNIVVTRVVTVCSIHCDVSRITRTKFRIRFGRCGAHCEVFPIFIVRNAITSLY